jgi:histidinol dehydrogenase
MITKLDSSQADFKQRLDTLLAFEASTDDAIDRAVAGILADVKARGDAAVLEYTNRFDRLHGGATSMAALDIAGRTASRTGRLPEAQRRRWKSPPPRARLSRAPEAGTERLSYTEADGTVLGQKVTPLDRVGIYVPGGKAAYPSSVLMNAIPATWPACRNHHGGANAGRREEPDGAGRRRHCRRDRVFTIGGAQAVARWPTAPKPFRRSTRSSAPAMPMWPRPSAACSAWSAST